MLCGYTTHAPQKYYPDTGVRGGRRTASDAGPAAQDGAEQAHALVGRAADDVLDVVCAQAEVLRLWHDTWPAAQERSG